ncbi:SOS response-associated peptidase [Geobacillus sp. C56-T2]|uniref:SOS response-associated peptidase n=1 Tax=Geobacillus sp. C56-T2 TaxID=600773 RepID=UPI0011A14582|nr:SOS response-associated peptidase [Geobacillus sp. C56-T2]NNV06410.1 SOS response-associated peptidase [Geobacillus sp. MMMUD3]TWG30345.1 putative SOS response-associated peptidase YedK [Geobacillus sp. C56-T2]
MCGRFTLTAELETLQALFRFRYEGSLAPRFNIAPSQEVLTVVAEKGERVGKMMRWGLVPFWAKDVRIGAKMINARAETVDEKASFRHAFKRRRCLILADGFYEWKKEGKTKVPYRFTLATGTPFAFAGLWERWEGASGPLETCAIITTRANELIASIHDRMPVILPSERHDDWLDSSFDDSEYLKTFLQPYPSEQMRMYEVSALVNSPKNDVSACIEPVNSR